MRPAAERPGNRGEVICRECKTASPAGTSICPKCGYPLILDVSEREQVGVDESLFRKPDDPPPADDTSWINPVSGRAPRTDVRAEPAGGTTICPTCGRRNTAGQERWCEWCGADMRPARPTPPPIDHVGAPPPPVRRRSRLGYLLTAGLIAVLLLAGMTWALTRNDDGTETPPPGQGPTDVVVGPVAADRITATASSTIQQSKNKFSIRNTLDGKDTTAWNSDGRKVDRGIGVTLTYRFDRPIDLRAIRVHNGYVTSPELGTGAYLANGRLKQVRVRTDGGERTWNLKDTPKLQSFSQPFGRTAQVRLEVVSVYPGSEYTDLALTDIVFDAAE